MRTDRRKDTKKLIVLFLSFRRVVNVIYSFLGNSPASYWLCHFPAPTQPGINTPRNPATDILHSPAYEDGTDTEFWNVAN